MLISPVELGRRYFPNCSEVLDKIFSEESIDSACFKCCNAEDKQIKRTRFCQLKDEVLKALDKDKAAAAAITSTASSSSTSRYGGMSKQHRFNTPRGKGNKTWQFCWFKCYLFNVHDMQKYGVTMIWESLYYMASSYFLMNNNFSTQINFLEWLTVFLEYSVFSLVILQNYQHYNC